MLESNQLPNDYVSVAVSILKLGTLGENRTPISAFVAPYSYPLNYKGIKQQVSFNSGNRTHIVCLEGKLSSIDMLVFAEPNLKLGGS